MIHSLAGGILSDNEYWDFAKVEFFDEELIGQTHWYISKIYDLKEGDIVCVPYGKKEIKKEAKVLRIDKHISSQTPPIPLKLMKEILYKIS